MTSRVGSPSREERGSEAVCNITNACNRSLGCVTEYLVLYVSMEYLPHGIRINNSDIINIWINTVRFLYYEHSREQLCS